jgi:hypothetical protein
MRGGGSGIARELSFNGESEINHSKLHTAVKVQKNVACRDLL